MDNPQPDARFDADPVTDRRTDAVDSDAPGPLAADGSTAAATRPGDTRPGPPPAGVQQLPSDAVPTGDAVSTKDAVGDAVPTGDGSGGGSGSGGDVQGGVIASGGGAPVGTGAAASAPAPSSTSLLGYLALYTLLRVALVVALTAVLMIFMPLIVALLFAIIVQLPLSWLLFAGLRRKVNESMALVSQRRRDERARLQSALHGDDSRD